MRLSRRGLLTAAGLTTGAFALAACGRNQNASSSPSAGLSEGYLTADALHTVEITIDEAAYQEMLNAYSSSQTKEWLEATVTVDGVTHERAGIRLKGNSSLKSVSTDTPAQDLPWLVRFDKFVDGQTHEGLKRMVIRSSSTTSALNEAVALDLLAKAGLSSERAAYISLTVNGSDPALRLTCQDLDEQWVEQNFDVEGLLYKAESTGDYSYRGTDATAYEDVFDQETGEANLTPLIEFLQFINESSDTDFKAKLAQKVNVEQFVTYLAFEDLIDNFDDITGPGNNSFLWWNAKANQMTVVAWDHNSAFGARPSAGQGPGGQEKPPQGQAPSGAPPAQGGQPPAGRGPGDNRANALVDRFTTLLDGEAKVNAEVSRLKKELYSGQAQEALDARVAMLTEQASSLIDEANIKSDADTIAAYFAK